RLHGLWLGVEDAVARRLLEAEASKQGISVDELREKEILSQVTAPSDAELQQIYDANQELIGVPFEMAKEHLAKEIQAERLTQVERLYLGTLREKAEVSFSLPVPPLPRKDFRVGEGPSTGPKDAKVTVVTFSDFQCPYCA